MPEVTRTIDLAKQSGSEHWEINLLFRIVYHTEFLKQVIAFGQIFIR